MSVDLATLRERYGPKIAPPCPVCGGLRVRACRHGVNSTYYCRTIWEKFHTQSKLEAAEYTHFNQSKLEMEDWSDDGVMAALDELAAFRDAMTCDRAEPPDCEGEWAWTYPGLTPWVATVWRDSLGTLIDNDHQPVSKSKGILWGRRPLPMPAVKGESK